jgi:hypothetical protein
VILLAINPSPTARAAKAKCCGFSVDVKTVHDKNDDERISERLKVALYNTASSGRVSINCSSRTHVLHSCELLLN